MSLPQIEKQPFFPIDDLTQDTDSQLWDILKIIDIADVHESILSPLHKLGHASIVAAVRPAFLSSIGQPGIDAFSEGFGAYEFLALQLENPESTDRASVLKNTVLLQRWLSRADTFDKLETMTDYAHNHNPRLLSLLGKLAAKEHRAHQDYFLA
ncbi:MAG TPA: hypothetical protein VFT59_03495, partial [Candidatus Saccharimonadales bacterium]|nr:hypothetical protein [Candidatus Saccharimonadales bacterium]